MHVDRGLETLRADILSEIDGGDECRGRDSQLTEWAERVSALRAALQAVKVEADFINVVDETAEDGGMTGFKTVAIETRTEEEVAALMALLTGKPPGESA